MSSTHIIKEMCLNKPGGQPVGWGKLVQISKAVCLVKWCSQPLGTAIYVKFEDKFGVMTCNHVVATKLPSVRLVFNYDDVDCLGESSKLEYGEYFKTDESLDFTLAEVSEVMKNALDVCGIQPLDLALQDETDIVPGASVSVIGHPGGSHKHESSQGIKSVKTTLLGYWADTKPGSSGSAVIVNGKLVAMHTQSNIRTQMNEGTRVSAILDFIKTQEQMNEAADEEKKLENILDVSIGGDPKEANKRALVCAFCMAGADDESDSEDEDDILFMCSNTHCHGLLHDGRCWNKFHKKRKKGEHRKINWGDLIVSASLEEQAKRIVEELQRDVQNISNPVARAFMHGSTSIVVAFTLPIPRLIDAIYHWIDGTVTTNFLLKAVASFVASTAMQFGGSYVFTLAGAGIGALGGPIGVVVGLVLGALAGMFVGGYIYQKLEKLIPGSEEKKRRALLKEAFEEFNFDSSEKNTMTKKEVEKRFRVLALKCHPDRPNGTKEKFIKLYVLKIVLLKLIDKRDGTADVGSDSEEEEQGRIES